MFLSHYRKNFSHSAMSGVHFIAAKVCHSKRLRKCPQRRNPKATLIPAPLSIRRQLNMGSAKVSPSALVRFLPQATGSLSPFSLYFRIPKNSMRAALKGKKTRWRR